MKKILNPEIFLYVFWLIGIITLGVIIYNLFSSDKFSNFLPAFGILISAFIASLSIMKTINNTNELDKIKTKNELSKYYVEKCIDGFEIVFNLLKDQNNNRSTWIEAARILKYTLDISNEITECSYKKIYNIKVFQYRHLLLKELTNEYGNSLRTSFFFGIKNWSKVNPEEANRIAKASNQANGIVQEYEVPPYPELAYLNESSIKIIFDFLNYESNFDDPLENEKINNLEEWKEEGNISNIKRGAYNYLKFKKDNNITF